MLASVSVQTPQPACCSFSEVAFIKGRLSSPQLAVVETKTGSRHLGEDRAVKVRPVSSQMLLSWGLRSGQALMGLGGRAA